MKTNARFVLPSGIKFRELSPVTKRVVTQWKGNVRPEGQLKAVVFDLGNVIFDFDFSLASRAICGIEGIRNEDIRRDMDSFLGGSKYHAAVEKGIITFPEFFTVFKENFGLRKTGPEQFLAAWNSIFSLNRDSESFAAALQDAGIVTFLLSDTNRPHFTFLSGMSRIMRRADEKFLSFETEMYKSDGPKIFDRVIRTLKSKYGIPSGSAIFFDDKPAYTAMMVSRGLPAHTFTNAADAETVIKEVWGWEG